jgi:phage-related protein
MDRDTPLQVVFYQTAAGREPVREWLKSLPMQERKIIGEDIKTVQYGFPLGMPLVRKLKPDLWEVRSVLPNRIARSLFTLYEGHIVLLHGLIKKSQKTPVEDLELALKRLANLLDDTGGKA